MRIVMTPTKTCHRIIVIGGSVPDNKNVEYPESIPMRRTTGQRIVIIRNGQFVASERGSSAREPG
jgi:hypothetical protein